jgi:putative intracellular protease/amidase
MARQTAVKGDLVSASIDIVDPAKPKHVAILASNPAVSPVTGWPVGFWWGELVHPYWELTEHGYEVDIYSVDGGALVADAWSDPRDESGFSADDILSLGFLVGGQAPMVTFVDEPRVHELVRRFYEAGKVTAIVCHATSVLLKTTLSDGTLLAAGKTWTGFADSEEDFADEFVGQRMLPFRIEEEARKLAGTNFIVNSRFKPFAVRDGLLITGQQQYSTGAAAKLVIEALGV